ncbi:Phage protein D [Providencia rustigianii]|nr:Phage protein D [Providencia rustigianii]
MGKDSTRGCLVSIQLARGRADLYPEMPIIVRGFKPEIDNAEWTLTRVVHSLNDSGYMSALELEVRVSDLDMAGEEKLTLYKITCYTVCNINIMTKGILS